MLAKCGGQSLDHQRALEDIQIVGDGGRRHLHGLREAGDVHERSLQMREHCPELHEPGGWNPNAEGRKVSFEYGHHVTADPFPPLLIRVESVDGRKPAPPPSVLPRAYAVELVRRKGHQRKDPDFARQAFSRRHLIEAGGALEVEMRELRQLMVNEGALSALPRADDHDNRKSLQKKGLPLTLNPCRRIPYLVNYTTGIKTARYEVLSRLNRVSDGG